MPRSRETLFRLDDIKVTMAQRQTLDNDDNSDIVPDTKMRRNIKVDEVVDILPLCVHVVVDLLVCDGQHHDEDPEQDHTDHELVEDPHGDHRRVDRVSSRSPLHDAAGHVVTGHAGQVLGHHNVDPEK